MKCHPLLSLYHPHFVKLSILRIIFEPSILITAVEFEELSTILSEV